MGSSILAESFALDNTATDIVEIRRRIKYENELDKAFRNKIAESAHGEKLYGCIQCGMSGKSLHGLYSTENNHNYMLLFIFIE